MSRYIDITTINPRVYESSEVELGVLAYDYDEICAMPFLDIVRCKDCRYWIGELTEDQEDAFVDECRWRTDEQPNSDDFCSYGERKTDHE